MRFGARLRGAVWAVAACVGFGAWAQNVQTVADGRRLLLGYVDPAAMVDFLNASLPAEPAASTMPFVAALALAFLGGLAMNLTPCVLPMIPVNIAIVGKKWSRGLLYGGGQALACGALGLAAAIGGVAVGTIQSSPWFTGAAAVVLLFLALALADVFAFDLTSFRPVTAHGARTGLSVFGTGMLSVLLAGACVEPALVTVLVVTADGVGAGHAHYAALPFVFGLGMGTPWPLVGAGLGVLPKPGVWMVWFRRALALAVLALSVRYAYVTYRIVAGRNAASPSSATAPASPVSSKPLFYEISAPWCRYCTKLEETTMRDAAVRKALERYEVRRIVINDFDELAFLPDLRGLDISGIPACIIVPARRPAERK